MRLPDILDEAISLGYGTLPCVIHHQQQSTPADGFTYSCLTYAAAANAMNCHQSLLRKVLKSRFHEKQVVVAFLAHNSTDLLLATMACSSISHAVPVLLNTRWTVVEMAQALESQNSRDCTLIVCDTSHVKRAKQVATRLGHNHCCTSTLLLSAISLSLCQQLVVGNNYFNQQSMQTTQASKGKNQIDKHSYSSETAMILFTSGTTSGSKGVLLSHRALMIQARAKLAAPCQYDTATKMLATTVPFFHVGGMSSALAVWMAGGALIFPTPASVGFQPQTMISSLSQGPQLSSSTLVVVPAMLSSLMDALSSHDTDESFPNVKLVLIGGQSATLSLLHQVKQRFPNARLVQTYACTEAASSLTFFELHTTRRASTESTACDSMDGDTTAVTGDCIGSPPSHVDLQLMSDPTGNNGNEIRKPFTAGIIATRGPHLFTGYWRRGGIQSSSSLNGSQQSTSQGPTILAFDSPLTFDGWLLTNDLGYRDGEGRFYFSGRVVDVIRTGGETVLATEVERILLRHEAIVECAVFALPDEKFGETVCAAIVSSMATRKEQGGTYRDLKLTNLRQWCAQQGLAGYKRPRKLFWVHELPRNSSGKVVKRALVELYRERQQLESVVPCPPRSQLRSKL
jgi:acyl-CoA synthetase (AMP-forming)/AMP-acid ligase II